MRHESPALDGSAPILLLYDFAWADQLLPPSRECRGCQFITDTRRLADAHVVLFHVPTIPPLQGIPKHPGQIWVALCSESEVNYPCLSDLEFMRHFDLTMTYRLCSDIPGPYLQPSTRDALRRRPVPKTEVALAAFFASNGADRCGRMEYVQDLMRHVQVDSYGKCLTNRKLPEDRGAITKLNTIAR